ncbi:YkvI family membrane protein [Anaerosalibacter bizertensis]|uniref:YkvI family membrane protein n=1 Tax=Anaerosalibacter bizertensis TaxID=932217 RepID=UPI001C0F1B18|nr:hypothetical protein [Anaerosalibacter bizertensis]MBU5294310.1 hypothetical protein [Anaerosalibacter bizertensis]
MNKDVLKLAFIYIGTIIGAGFASGREIIDFFGVYGAKGIIGMVLSSFLFMFIGAFFLSKIYEKKINGYENLINNIFGEKLGFFIDTVIILSLFIGYCIMVSGSGALFNQEFNLSKNIGIYLMVILSFITFLFSLEGLSFINSILVPLLVLGIIYFGGNVIIEEGFIFSNLKGIEYTNKGNFITSSILYVGFNSLLLIVILSSLLPIITNKKVAIKGGLMGGGILGVLGCFILIPLLILYTQVYALDIPMLNISGYGGRIYSKIFSVILWLAMFTTAIANGFGFIERVSKKRNHIFTSFLFCLSSIPLAKLGFSNLVATIYPIFGYFGGFILLVSIIRLI